MSHMILGETSRHRAVVTTLMIMLLVMVWLMTPPAPAADSGGGLVWTRIAGNGFSVYTGTSGVALDVGMDPVGLAAAPGGGFYVADAENKCVRLVDSQGLLTTVAGLGFDYQATIPMDIMFMSPSDVVVDGQGRLYISDHKLGRIFLLDPTRDMISPVAGEPGNRKTGDGGPALAAQISPVAMALGPDGSLFICEADSHRVRRVDPAGIITTVIGSGRSGFRGDGGPASRARLNCPMGITLDGQGNLYIADSGNCRVRRVSPTGQVDTVAGNGQEVPSGDGGLATAAGLVPMDVAIMPDGTVLVADRASKGLRRFVPGGAIESIAMAKSVGMGADEAGMARVLPDLPVRITPLSEDVILVIDGGNRQVLKLQGLSSVPPPRLAEIIVSSDSMTYLDRDAGFSLSVPVGWFREEKAQNNQRVTYACELEPGVIFRLGVNIEEAEGMAIQTFVQRHLNQVRRDTYQFRVEKMSQEKVSGRPVVFVHYWVIPDLVHPPMEALAAFIPTPSRGYVVTVSGMQGYFGHFRPALMQLFEGFKLLDQTMEDPGAGSK